MQTFYSIDVDKTQSAGVHITAEQAKNYLKVEFDVTAENTLIESITKAAEEQAEEIINRCINQKDVTLLITSFEREDANYPFMFRLPYRGTISSLVVTGIDEGTETVINSSEYYVNGRNILNVNDTLIGYDELKVTYTIAPLNLPIGLDTAILKLIGDYYVNRTNDSLVTVSRISESTRAMLTPFEDVKSWI